MAFYDITFRDSFGSTVSMSEFRGKVVLNGSMLGPNKFV